jgi:hypothetical protein
MRLPYPVDVADFSLLALRAVLGFAPVLPMVASGGLCRTPPESGDVGPFAFQENC